MSLIARLPRRAGFCPDGGGGFPRRACSLCPWVCKKRSGFPSVCKTSRRVSIYQEVRTKPRRSVTSSAILSADSSSSVPSVPGGRSIRASCRAGARGEASWRLSFPILPSSPVPRLFRHGGIELHFSYWSGLGYKKSGNLSACNLLETRRTAAVSPACRKGMCDECPHRFGLRRLFLPSLFKMR